MSERADEKTDLYLSLFENMMTQTVADMSLREGWRESRHVSVTFREYDVADCGRDARECWRENGPLSVTFREYSDTYCVKDVREGWRENGPLSVTFREYDVADCGRDVSQRGLCAWCLESCTATAWLWLPPPHEAAVPGGPSFSWALFSLAASIPLPSRQPGNGQQLGAPTPALSARLTGRFAN